MTIWWDDDSSFVVNEQTFKHSLVFQSSHHRHGSTTRVQHPCTCQRISLSDSCRYTICTQLGLAPQGRGNICTFLSNTFAQQYSPRTSKSSECPMSRLAWGMTCISLPAAFSPEIVPYSNHTVLDRLSFRSLCIVSRRLPEQ